MSLEVLLEMFRGTHFGHRLDFWGPQLDFWSPQGGDLGPFIGLLVSSFGLLGSNSILGKCLPGKRSHSIIHPTIFNIFVPLGDWGTFEVIMGILKTSEGLWNYFMGVQGN